MFYGGFDIPTAKAETESGKKETDTHITIGEFNLLAMIKGVDFSQEFLPDSANYYISSNNAVS